MNILIDDDKFIRLSWSLKAKHLKISLTCFESVEDFLIVSNNYETNTKIYIDSNLGQGKKGEAESKKISNLGFKNIFLTTGYEDLDITPYPWIKKLVTKSFPIEND